MKTGLISNVITLMFAQAGVEDNTDLVRCNILAMEIERNTHTIDTIKQTSSYLGCNYDVPMTDGFLQSLLNKKVELEDFYNESELNALEGQTYEG